MCRGDGPFDLDLFRKVFEGLGDSSRQSAGVGGTVSRVVPLPGGPRCRNGSVGPNVDEGLSVNLFRLCERAEAGGGPGGGGGIGIVDSHVTGLGEWLFERDDAPLMPIAPVDAALLAAGGCTYLWRYEGWLACSNR